MSIALKVEDVSKMYRLGNVGTGTLSHDLNRFWAKLRGLPDPNLKIGAINDRTESGNGDYVWALNDINLEVQQGEILGIIGRNGAGKSTLLKLLSRVTAPTTGSIKTRGRIASLLEVGTGFHPELTGRENVYLNGAIMGMTRPEIKKRLDEIVEFSGCAKYIDTPVKRYSSGMTVRLGFAVAAHLESEILIVDEVLAVGDAEFRKKCIGKMQDVGKLGRTIIFVSHNMASVNRLCSRVAVLKNGEVEGVGETGEVVSKYLSFILGKHQCHSTRRHFSFRKCSRYRTRFGVEKEQIG
jgi:lipopolysaccharide transport system ATP-binding protein